jgi:hypothetical protein
MTQDKFDYFYKEFEQMNSLLEKANSQKTKDKNKENVFEVYKTMKEYNILKKKIITEFSEINPNWTKRYEDYDNHPKRMLPFPEIYDLTELDEKNFNFFQKEFEKLDSLFLKAYCDVERYKTIDEEDETEEEETTTWWGGKKKKKKKEKLLDNKTEKKLKGYIGGYYSINSVLDYNKQEEKIKTELSKINQKWLESVNEHQLVRYKGDTSIKTEEFRHPEIYILFEKLLQHSIEIQKLKEEKSTYKLNEKQFKFDEIKKEILEME